MTQEMIDLARRNAYCAADGHPLTNVEFHLATIDNLPLPDASADCVISKCVINLAPDKGAVLREVFRVLRPGGRLAVSDIALKQELPGEVRDSLPAYIGCIAGAILIDEYQRLLMAAGFSAVEVIDTGSDLNAYAKAENAACCVPAASSETKDDSSLAVVSSAACCGTEPSAAPGVHEELADLLRRYDVNRYAASVRVLAVKPQANA
jgi:SAM-dependent methyltransferase